MVDGLLGLGRCPHQGSAGDGGLTLGLHRRVRVVDQLVGRLPSVFLFITHDQMGADAEAGRPAGVLELLTHGVEPSRRVRQRLDPVQVHVCLAAGKGVGPGRGPSQVELGRLPLRDGGAEGVFQLVVLALELHRPRLRPQLAAGGDEFFGALVAGALVGELTHPFKVVLYASRYDIDVDATLGYLV